jgi:pimeloyl-ACP methyl ester carboxylesterase
MIKKAMTLGITLGLLSALATPVWVLGKDRTTDAREIQMVKVSDISIAYKQYGSERGGTPLLLIMGYGCTMDIWPPALLDQLSAHYRVIVFDNRGMGLSTGSGQEVTIELLADDAVEFLKNIGVSRAHVLGWSMGASVAQEIALRHPDQVARLILCGGYCGGKEALRTDKKTWDNLTDLSGTIEERITRMFTLLFSREWLKEHPDRSEYFPPFTEPVEDESILRQARAMDRWAGTFDRLQRITQNTLIVTGTDDAVIPPGNSFIMAERIPGSSVIQFKGGGHGLMYQYPHRLGRFLTTFLQD